MLTVLPSGRQEPEEGLWGPHGSHPKAEPGPGLPRRRSWGPGPTRAPTLTPTGHGVGEAALPGPPPPRRGHRRQQGVPVWLWALRPFLQQPCRGCSARGCPALAKREGGSWAPPAEGPRGLLSRSDAPEPQLL